MIVYQTDVSALTPDQLQGPFFVGWLDPPSPETHLAILQGSAHAVVALDETDQRVVGFITAITDGVLTAHISLLEVVPEYQGRGIGSDLVRLLIDELGDYYAIDALVDPELRPFYHHLGLEPASAVMLRNYARQSGAPR